MAVCLTCTAGVTLPVIPEADLGRLYPENYGPYEERMSRAERLISRVIRGLQARRVVATEPLRALRGSRGRAVDVGCGRGDLAAALVARGWRTVGVEPSAAACERAKLRGIDARCGTLATISLEPDTYNAVIFRHSLEHTTDPVAALRAAAAALTPQGVVLISVPNFASWQAGRFAGCWYHLDLPRHRFHFTAPALEAALRRAGLEPLSVASSSSAVGLPASLQYRLFGRCLFPAGAGLRIASGACVAALPVSSALDRLAGGGDTLHVVARRAMARSSSASNASAGAG